MTEKEIHDIFNSIRNDLTSQRLIRAMDTLTANAEQSMNWEVSDKIKAIARDYSYMLDYMAAGYPDEHRLELYRGIIERTLATADQLERNMLSAKRPSLYFSTMRVAESSGKSISSLISAFTKLCDDSDNIFARLTSSNDTPDGDRTQVENAAVELFNAIWTSYPISTPDRNALKQYLANENENYVWRSLLLSSLMLGELEFHDAVRLELIIDLYRTSHETRFRAQALVAMLLSLYRHHKRGIEKSIENRIKLLQDTDSWSSDLRSAFIEFIRTRDTKRVNHTMTNEIIPSMMNLRPEVIKRFENLNIDMAEVEGLEFNPEWEEALNASGITDKLKQMSEMQSEGADVFMSTFSHLKRFSMFHEPAGWFTPFDPESTRVQKAIGGNELAARTIAELPFLCDSDKYSLVLSLDMVPEAQRQIMFSQFDAQRTDFYEAMSQANETTIDDMRRQLRNYLQNLYRFLELFRRKGEFYNPFDKGVNLLSIHVLADDFDDTETLRTIAEFFLKLGYWDDALDVFILLSSLDKSDEAAVWQKIGYCHENLKNIAAAIEAYERAEMLAPGSKWLWNRLYKCHRSMGDYKLALDYARRIADGTSLSATLTLGYALLDAGLETEALTEFRRAEFIDESSDLPLRPIAWTLFLEKRFDDSRRYYKRIMDNAPKANDILNFAHLELAAENLHEAYILYKQTLYHGMSHRDFYANIYNDTPILNKLGISIETIAMICDAVSSERSTLPPYPKS